MIDQEQCFGPECPVTLTPKELKREISISEARGKIKAYLDQKDWDRR